MSEIHLTSFIAAPIERVFDLSRSINLHQISTIETYEKAIHGVLNGLINKNETVTWQAKHLFKTRQFTTKITEMQSPDFFIDVMTRGDFKFFYHEHHFKSVKNGTIMIDVIKFESPYGFIGKIVEVHSATLNLAIGCKQRFRLCKYLYNLRNGINTSKLRRSCKERFIIAKV